MGPRMTQKKNSTRHLGYHPQAMYRTSAGTEWFMGIVVYQPNNDMVKLDDPTGEVDSPGHIMTNREFLSECYRYDKYTHRPTLPTIQTQGFSLVDFTNKPPNGSSDNDDKESDYGDDRVTFDTMYPRGISPPPNRRFIGNDTTRRKMRQK